MLREREPKMNKEQVVTDGQSDGHTNMVTPTHSFFLLYVNLEFSSESDLHTALSALSQLFPGFFSSLLFRTLSKLCRTVGA